MKQYHEDEDLQRLLAAARPPRKMKEAERARTAMFVAALAKKKPARRESHERLGWWCLAFAAIALLCFFRGDVSNGGGELGEVTIAAEPITPTEETSAWYDPARIRASREGVSVPMAAPSQGDVCGARVCERDPSCCDRAWDAHCDGLLLDLTYRDVFTVSVGRCYWVNRETCPNCACPMYLKRIEDREQGITLGYDGGTGCIRDPAKMLVELRWMCMQGYCDE